MLREIVVNLDKRNVVYTHNEIVLPSKRKGPFIFFLWQNQLYLLIMICTFHISYSMTLFSPAPLDPDKLGEN